MDTTLARATEAGRCPYSGDNIAVETLTIGKPEVTTNPHAYWHAMRERDPVHYDPQLNMWLVTRYDDLQKVLSDPITFSVKHGYHEQQAHGFFEDYKRVLDEEGGGYVPDSVGIMTDPPDHARIRRLLEKAFTAHRVKTLEPGTAQIMNKVIDEIGPRGKAEAMKEIAGPFTVGVITEQLGLTEYDSRQIQHWTESAVAAIARMQDRPELIRNAKATAEMQSCLIGHIKQRQQQRSEDMISDLVYARLDDEAHPTLTLPELISLTRTLLVGGSHTTTTAMGNLIFTLATRPDIARQLQECAEDERQLNRFVEELLRFEPPTIGLSRMTTKEVELGGKKLPKGAHMLLLYASANYDEKEFPCPWQFDTTRPNLRRHMSFGSGVHLCVGLALARMEVKIAAREIARRLDNIKLDCPIEDLKCLPSVAARTYESLPITFTLRK